MQNNNSGSLGKSLKSTFASLAILICLIAGWLIWAFILGNHSHFDDAEKHVPNDMLGRMYVGGIIVPFLVGLLLIVLTFTIERFLTIWKAKGRGNMDNFLMRVKMLLDKGDISAALAECDRQRGSLGNVVRAGLIRYQEVADSSELDREAKLAAIQKELEEATTLELPMLERNLVILATIASIATLMGLLGTVIGMIRAFAALAQAGAPDAIALSTGISEALINTALGILTSAISIIMYNFFTNNIDGLTYRIDEAGFSIAQNFAAHTHKKQAVTV